MEQIAELNLQMAFVLTYFKVTDKAAIIGVDGKTPTKYLAQVFQERREGMIAYLEQKLGAPHGEGTDEQAQGDLLPASEGEAVTNGEDTASRANVAPLVAKRGDSRITH